MIDLQRMTASLWRSAENQMRYHFGNPHVMSDLIPPDMMDTYERARRKAIELKLRDMLHKLEQNIERNLEEFNDGKLPSCLRSKNDRD